MGSSTREPVARTGDLVEGRYRILDTLGAGGMGTVFLAEHALIKRRVAIKILHPELATDADVIERFMNEARAAGTLGHPNIVESTDMGFLHNHVPYIVFEFLEGALLTDEIYRLGGLPVRRAVRIATQIASALHAAHNAGVIHRDLKSDNVFLTDKDDAFDHVKVLDFGISRFLELDDRQKGMVMGTPEFMAPEQITDPEHVDRRADIYALGVILYEMLTARRPFAAEDDPRQLMQRIVSEAPAPLVNPEIPHKLAETILTRLLAKSPDDRYQTMSDVEAALETFITRSDGTPVPTRRSQPLLMETSDDGANASDPARSSGTIPRPVRARSPSPASVAAALRHVSLPPIDAKRARVLYAIAGLGVAIGVAGLAFGIHRGGDRAAAGEATSLPGSAGAGQVARTVPAVAPSVAVDLTADVANAHVTFRRRVAAAPVALELEPSHVVELVEVSAPGYKTSRYWLTFDHPMHLRAHLVKGRGLVEASEEQTLVALGEVPAQHAGAAAGLDSAAASTVERAHRADVDRCIATGKTHEAALRGTIRLQLQVDAAGKVHRAQVQSTLEDPVVAACVEKAADGWRFPARAGGELATVSYPFTVN